MSQFTRWLCLVSCVLSAASARAVDLAAVEHEGVPMRVQLGADLDLNPGSALYSRWIVLTDSTAPVRIAGRTGVEVVLYGDGSRAALHYSAGLALEPQRKLTAVEVRYALFDVFGRFVRVLSAEYVQDINGAQSLLPRWRVSSNIEASTVFVSVGYVEAAREADGRVYRLDREVLLKALRAAQLQATGSDLGKPR